MMRGFLRLLVLSAILPFSAAPALAAAPSSGVGTLSGPRNDANRPTTRSIDEYQGLGFDRQFADFTGTVLDVDDQPVSDAIVDLFVDGALAGSATTDGSGAYEIKVPYDLRSDTTVLLWYVPQSGHLLPKELVIRESKASRDHAVISACVPRAEYMPGRQFRVYLFDTANRNKDLAEMNCLP